MNIERHEVFARWLGKLRDAVAADLIAVRLARISETGNIGDARAVGGGVSEIKIDHGPGYRVYYMMRGSTMMLLLVGGDKSTQQEDVKRAKKMAINIRKVWKNV